MLEVFGGIMGAVRPHCAVLAVRKGAHMTTGRSSKSAHEADSQGASGNSAIRDKSSDSRRPARSSAARVPLKEGMIDSPEYLLSTPLAVTEQSREERAENGQFLPGNRLGRKRGV